MTNLINKVFLNIKRKNYRRALDLLFELDLRYEISWTRNYLKGFCFRKIGDFLSSIYYYEEALVSSSDKPLVLNAMGTTYQDLNELCTAVSYFKNSAKLLKSEFQYSSKYSFYRKELLSEVYNNLGVIMEIKSEEECLPNHSLTSLIFHYDSLCTLEDAFKFHISNKIQRVMFNNERDYNNQKHFELQRIRYKNRNFSLFHINLASQLYRLGEIEKSEKCLNFCIRQINFRHEFWNTCVSALSLLKEKTTLYNKKNIKFYFH